MNTGDWVGVFIIFAMFAIALIGMLLYAAYAAGWNAAVDAELRRDPMDPFRKVYR